MARTTGSHLICKALKLEVCSAVLMARPLRLEFPGAVYHVATIAPKTNADSSYRFKAPRRKT